MATSSGWATKRVFWLVYLSSVGDASKGKQAAKHAAWEAATLH